MADVDIEVVFNFPVRRSAAQLVDPGELDAEVERLRYRIVTSLAAGNGSADEAVSLLVPHRSAPEGVVLAALLVCTHRRFERCARTLMGRLAADKLLTPSQLDAELLSNVVDGVVREVPAAHTSSVFSSSCAACGNGRVLELRDSQRGRFVLPA